MSNAIWSCCPFGQLFQVCLWQGALCSSLESGINDNKNNKYLHCTCCGLGCFKHFIRCVMWFSHLLRTGPNILTFRLRNWIIKDNYLCGQIVGCNSQSFEPSHSVALESVLPNPLDLYTAMTYQMLSCIFSIFLRKLFDVCKTSVILIFLANLTILFASM